MMGRGKVQLKRIQKAASREVTFSKRRNSLLKKACELSVLCGAEVSLLTESQKPYHFSSNEMDKTIAKYRTGTGLTNDDNRHAQSTEYWNVDAGVDNMKKIVQITEEQLKHFTGEDLYALGLRDIMQLESQIRTVLECIQARKCSLLMEHISLLKRKQNVLQEENAVLLQRLESLAEATDLRDEREGECCLV